MALRFSFLPGDNWNSKLSSAWTERRRSQLAVCEGAWPAVVSLAGPMGNAAGSFPALPSGMQSAALFLIIQSAWHMQPSQLLRH